MKTEIDPVVAQWLTEIGEKTKDLRKEHSGLNYKAFSEELLINANTYQRIENGENYTFSALLEVMRYYKNKGDDIKLSQLLSEIGL